MYGPLNPRYVKITHEETGHRLARHLAVGRNGTSPPSGLRAALAGLLVRLGARLSPQTAEETVVQFTAGRDRHDPKVLELAA